MTEALTRGLHHLGLTVSDLAAAQTFNEFNVTLSRSPLPRLLCMAM